MRIPAGSRRAWALQPGAAGSLWPKSEESGSAAPAASAQNGVWISGKKVVVDSFVLGFSTVFLDEVRTAGAE